MGRNIQWEVEESSAGNNTVYIYVLCEPSGNDVIRVRYVGQSSNPVARFQSHIQQSMLQRNNTPVAEWIRGLREWQQSPLMVVCVRLDCGPRGGLINPTCVADGLERHLIDTMLDGKWFGNFKTKVDLLNCDKATVSRRRNKRKIGGAA